MLSNPLTYEIMDYASVGLAQSEIVLGKHSGRHALGTALVELGYELDRDELAQAFARFKEVADRKGQVTAADLEAIVHDEMRVEAEGEGLPSWRSSTSWAAPATSPGPASWCATPRATGTRPRPSATGRWTR